MKLTNALIPLLAVSALALPMSPAVAGLKANPIYQITKNADGSGNADGALGTVRNSPDQHAWIGCVLVAYTTGPSIMCQAVDADGHGVACWSSNPELAKAVAAQSASERLSFRWDANANCTEVAVSTFSLYAPISP